MREFNTQMAQKERELETAVQETIGKHAFYPMFFITGCSS